MDLRLDNFYGGSQPAKAINQGSRPYITSAALPDVLWDRGNELKAIHSELRPGGDSATSVLAPRAVLCERFYRSRSHPIKQGRRQEPRMHHQITAWSQPQAGSSLPCRRPPSVRDPEGETTKPSLDPGHSSNCLQL